MSSRKRSAVKPGPNDGLTITRSVRRPWPQKGFFSIKHEVLGSSYELSLVLIGDARARALARSYRGYDATSNVLSFPLGPNAGEIYLNLAQASREASRFGLTPEGHAHYLFIHGCLHLAGHKHGSTMEEAEDALVRRFKLR